MPTRDDPGEHPADPRAAASGELVERADASDRGWDGLTLGVILIGSALRVAHFAGRGAFWGDEAALGYNLLARSFAGLARPLDLWQAAPVGFLWVEKGVGVALGMDERVLRLPPLLAAVATLGLVAWSTRALFGPRVAALAALLLTLAPELIHYGGELKPYSCDTALAAGLFALCARVARRDGPGDLRGLAVAGMLASWFSLPALFVLAGGGGTLLGRAALVGDRRGLLRLSVVAAVWVASFGAEYALCLRDAAREPELARYWASAFVPWPPTAPGAGRWLAAKAVYLFEPVVGLPARHLALGLFLAGSWLTWRRDRFLVAAMGGVVAATLAASAARSYPFSGRLLLFLMPILILPVAVALDRLLHGGRWPSRVVGLALLGALLASPAHTAATRLAADLRPDDSVARAVALIRTMADHHHPGDRFLIGRDADWVFRFYARRQGFDPPESIHLIDQPRATAGPPHLPISQLPPTRTWIFAALNLPDPADPEADRLARDLPPTLRPTLRHDDPALGVSLRRYEPSP